MFLYFVWSLATRTCFVCMSYASVSIHSCCGLPHVLSLKSGFKELTQATPQWDCWQWTLPIYDDIEKENGKQEKSGFKETEIVQFCKFVDYQPFFRNFLRANSSIKVCTAEVAVTQGLTQPKFDGESHRHKGLFSACIQAFFEAENFRVALFYICLGLVILAEKEW